MRKLLLLSSAAVMFFLFVGCGERDNPNNKVHLGGDYFQNKYPGITLVTPELSLALVCPTVYGPNVSPAYSTCEKEGDKRVDGCVSEICPKILWAGEEASIRFKNGEMKCELPAERNHVYFTSYTGVLRKVSYEELGIQPTSREALKEKGERSRFLREISNRITEYLKNHAEEIYGDVEIIIEFTNPVNH